MARDREEETDDCGGKWVSYSLDNGNLAPRRELVRVSLHRLVTRPPTQGPFGPAVGPSVVRSGEG